MPDTEHANLRTATGPLDGPMRCGKCGWSGLRSQALKAAHKNAGEPNEYYVACCPGCREFRLVAVTA